MQMDQATQQNAALVEEMAAAATSMQNQAQELVGTVAVFRLEQTGAASSAPTRYRAPQPDNVLSPQKRAIPPRALTAS